MPGGAARQIPTVAFLGVETGWAGENLNSFKVRYWDRKQKTKRRFWWNVLPNDQDAWPLRLHIYSFAPASCLMRRISGLDSPASLQRERNMESSLSNRFKTVSNSATRPAEFGWVTQNKSAWYDCAYHPLRERGHSKLFRIREPSKSAWLNKLAYLWYSICVRCKGEWMMKILSEWSFEASSQFLHPRC